MKRALSVLAVVFGVVVAVLAAALLYLTFGDLTRFRPEIEAAVSDSLGREFRLAGELEIEALPRPSFAATDVRLANADWASPEPMLAVGRVAVELDLKSLLFRPIRVERLEIADTKVLLEENADGLANYTFAPERAPPTEPAPNESGASTVPVVLESATITAADIVLRRPGADDFAVAIDSLEVSTSDEDLLSAALKGSAQDLAVTLDATLDPASALQTGGSVSYRFDAALNDAVVGLEGDIDSLFAAPSAAGDGSASRHIRFDGSVASLRLLGAVFDVADLPEQELTLSGDLSLGPDRVALEPFSLVLGESDATGSASAELGETLTIVVDAKSTKLDLTPFFPPAPEGNAEGAAATEGSAEAGRPGADRSPAPSEDALVFADEPLPFDLLRDLGLRMSLQAADLVVRDTQVRDLQLAIENSGGRATLKTSFNGTQDGSAEGEVVLDATTDVAAVDANVGVADMRLNLLSSGIDDPLEIPPIGVNAQLKANGGTARALASSANGRIVVQQGAGLIDNSAVGIVSNDIIAQLFAALNPFSKEEEHTKLDCTVLALNVTDGAGKLEPVLLQTEKLQVVGKGDIDLRSEALDIEFNTKPRSGVGITADMLVTPFVKLTGTLAKPSVGLNTKGALLQGGAAVLTGGASLLVGGLADRATAEAGQCERALADAETASTGP
jgi:uncharacterized protein involved in outer membrane biogenesis